MELHSDQKRPLTTILIMEAHKARKQIIPVNSTVKPEI